jgi:predicted  nucleic acid-binding Zn-ribbon protein
MTEMMTVTELLRNDVATLSDELNGIDKRIRDAAKTGDQNAMISLRDRKGTLPALIIEAKRANLAERFSVARSRIGAFGSELKEASELSQRLNAEIDPALKELDRRRAELIANQQQANANRESLAFALRLEEQKHAALVSERESLLLSHFGTN